MSYFTPTEFMCKCKTNNGESCGLDVSQQVKNLLEEARKIAGIPFVINSGARCLEHNYKVKSRPTSSHIKGLAVDIQATTARDMSLIFDAITEVGFTRRGISFKDKFIHVDLDRDKPQKVIFGY